MKYLLCIICLMLGFAASTVHAEKKAPAPFVMVEGDFEAIVTWVLDGDSIKFRRISDLGARESECRMLHYNAPEMSRKERRAGRLSLKRLMGLIKGKRVIIWGMGHDRYGRLLCEVRLRDGTYINEIMRESLKGYEKRDMYLWKEMGQRKRGAK